LGFAQSVPQEPDKLHDCFLFDHGRLFVCPVNDFGFGMPDHFGNLGILTPLVFCSEIRKRLLKCASLGENSVYKSGHTRSTIWAACDRDSVALQKVRELSEMLLFVCISINVVPRGLQRPASRYSASFGHFPRRRTMHLSHAFSRRCDVASAQHYAALGARSALPVLRGQSAKAHIGVRRTQHPARTMNIRNRYS
jgi:hypothetical protein